MNTREKLAYLAGIIDGEGSIMLWRSKIDPKRRGQFNLRVNVSNTSKALIEWLYNNFGGRFHEMNSPSRVKNTHWKKQYIWEVNRPDMLKFLNDIHEFLVIKREHCEIAIKFRQTFSKRERNLTEETFNIRLKLYEKMIHLNSRGS